MAISYESLIPEIAPHLYGCPDMVIANSIRASVIELCEKSNVYQSELEPLTTVSGIYEYDLEVPTSTAVHKVLWVTHDGKDLEPITTSLLEQRLPKWRETDQASTPKYFLKQTSALLWLVPVPSTTTAGSTVIRAVLKPTHTSKSCDNDVMNDYRDTIVNGALFRLLRIPNRDWTDYKHAQTYSALFAQGMVDAERRARNADTGVSRSVKYGGMSGAWRTRRNRYGRERG